MPKDDFLIMSLWKKMCRLKFVWWYKVEICIFKLFTTLFYFYDAKSYECMYDSSMSGELKLWEVKAPFLSRILKYFEHLSNNFKALLVIYLLLVCFPFKFGCLMHLS